MSTGSSPQLVKQTNVDSWQWWTLVGLGLGAFLAVFIALRLTDPTLPPSAPPARGSDLKSYFLPSMVFIHQSLMDLELPLWNPFQLAGSPFIASHHPGALYPLLVVFAPLPPHLALAAHALLHYALAGIFTALYARKIGAQAGACLAAGVAYMGCAPMVNAAFNTAYLSTFIWLPAILLAIEHMFQKPGRRAAVILAATLSLSFLAAHAQAFVYSVEVGALYGIARLAASQPRAQWPRIAGWSIAAGLIAAGLVAIQLLPAVEHASAGGRNLEGVNYGIARWPGLYWQQVPRILSGLDHRGTGVPFLFVPLAIAAIFSRWRTLALTFLVIFFLCIDFMAGSTGFGSKLYYALPAGNLFRFSTRMGFAYQLVAAVIMGLGTSAVITRSQRWGPKAAGAVGIALPALLALDLFWRNPLPYRFDLWSDPWDVSAVNATADLAKTTEYDRLFIQNHAWVTVPTKVGMLHSAFVVPDYDPLLPGAYKHMFGSGSKVVWQGRLDMVDPWPGERKKNHKPPVLQPPTRLDLLSVRYYVDARTIARLGPTKLGSVLDAKQIREGPPPVYERTTALPRTYIVKNVIAVASEDDALKHVHELAFDPTETAIVVGNTTLDTQPLTADDQAHITSFHRNDVSIEASCTSECLLVLTDLFDPDWTVHVNDQPHEILRTNYLVRGVRLEAGTHRVDFHYRAREFWKGAIITLAALLVSAYLLATGDPTLHRPATNTARSTG